METDRGKIIVNERYETSVPGIYAIGDVIGGIQLAHVATAEGRCAVAFMNGADAPVDVDCVPSCIYTSPEIASVGLTADEAKEKGIDVVSKKYPMSANGKTVLSLQERGFIKVIADKETGKVLGAQMMCARATDMISQFAQAVVNGLTLDDMSRVIYPHPTFSEGIGEAVR
jgi:dihydrolipoamide dehydrogenase